MLDGFSLQALLDQRAASSGTGMEYGPYAAPELTKGVPNDHDEKIHLGSLTICSQENGCTSEPFSDLQLASVLPPGVAADHFMERARMSSERFAMAGDGPVHATADLPSFSPTASPTSISTSSGGGDK